MKSNVPGTARTVFRRLAKVVWVVPGTAAIYRLTAGKYVKDALSPSTGTTVTDTVSGTREGKPRPSATTRVKVKRVGSAYRRGEGRCNYRRIAQRDDRATHLHPKIGERQVALGIAAAASVQRDKG